MPPDRFANSGNFSHVHAQADNHVACSPSNAFGSKHRTNGLYRPAQGFLAARRMALDGGALGTVMLCN